MGLELDPNELFIVDPNIPESEEDGIGYREKPDDEEEGEDASKIIEPENASEDEPEDDGDEPDKKEEDETSESEDGNAEDESGKSHAEEDVFEINGKEYTPESLSAHIADLERGSLRQSDYTTKTQTLAEQRKSLDSSVEFINALKDADLMDSIVEALETADVKNAKELAEKVLSGNAGEHPDTIKLQEVQSRLEQAETEKEAEKKLDEKVNIFAESKEIPLADAQAVRKFAEDFYEDKGVALDLDDAYDLWLVRKGKTVVKRKQPSVPNTPSAKRGGKPKGEGAKWDKMSAEHLFVD